MNALSRLERFADAARKSAGMPTCEMCALTLSEPHGHIVDRAERKLMCACRPCTLLFAESSLDRFRTVPQHVRVDPAWTVDEARWGTLGVPVRLAFFVHASSLGRWVAFFPSPAGITEAELAPGAWAEFCAGTELAARLEPDVEALLVRGDREGRFEAFSVPIDLCYELGAVIRRSWRGLDGGDEARAAVDALFAEVRRRAEPVAVPTGAT
jgi:hypothetical protein